MEQKTYFNATNKNPYKKKTRNRPLPKATQKYLEAEEALFQELEEHRIGYRRKFQFESTKNWRFDFYIVKLNLLIEIAGSSWAVGRGGRKIANAVGKYDLALDRGYVFERLEPHQIESGYAIKTRDVFTLTFDIKDSKGSKYSLNFPQLEVMEANHPDGGGDDIITLDINFAQVRTAPTIVRALV